MLLEKLIAMAIALIVTASMVTLLSGEIYQSKTYTRYSEQMQGAMIVKNLSSKILDSLDEHRLPLLPQIHKNGLITFRNGTLHSLSVRTDDLAPIPASDAITAIQLKRSNPLLRSRLGVICGTVAADEHVLVYSADLLFEAELATASGTHGSCRDSTISIPKKSVLFDQPNITEMTTPAFILPIEYLSTIYVSQEGSLRYVQHIGDRDVENQPMRSAAPLLSIAGETSPAGLYTLNLDLLFEEDAAPFHFEVQNVLSRRSPDAMLLQAYRGKAAKW